MKVRCIKLLNAHGQEVSSSPWMRLHGVYEVIEVVVGPQSGGTSFRVVTEQPTPAMYSVNQFELVDGRVPENWVVEVKAPGALFLSPKPWRERGFWERYFDDDPDAIRIYKEELAKILRGSNEE